jgi:hypothetical protein
MYLVRVPLFLWLRASGVRKKLPFAAAEGEWIKDDQQGELFEALIL